MWVQPQVATELSHKLRLSVWIKP